MEKSNQMGRWVCYFNSCVCVVAQNLYLCLVFYQETWCFASPTRDLVLLLYLNPDNVG